MSRLPLNDLVKLIRKRDTRTIARVLTAVAEEDPQVVPLLDALRSPGNGARRVGITGPPGTGKSTLIAALAHVMRASGETVAILAIDPSSPRSGGALLGDRFRMTNLSGDDGVFIRSFASRGNLGGVVATAEEALVVLEAAGFDRIILETVGAGQADVTVRHLAPTVLVLSAPGLGDTIQAQKAGILEIASLLVVNKADQPGADRLCADLRDLTTLSRSPWPKLVKTVATTGEGVSELLQAIGSYEDFLREGGFARWERERARTLLRQKVDALFWRTLDREHSKDWDAAVAEVAAGGNVADVARRIFECLRRKPDG